jgi:sarcosine oxidase
MLDFEGSVHAAGDADVRPAYDVVVVGLGIMGTAALSHVQRRGMKVLGVDAHGPRHERGSSHGETRIFRRAYWEGERYVPLLDRAHRGWMELDAAHETPIALRTGGLFVGRPDSTLVEGSRATAQRCGIEHELLQSSDIRARFPAFRVDGDVVAVYEPDALMLFADSARRSLLTSVVDGGGQVRFGRPVRSLTPTTGNTITVTGDGWQTSCGAVVLTVGGWIGHFLPAEIGPLVRSMRIPVFELDVDESVMSEHTAGRLPVFLLEGRDGALVYGLPQWRDGGGVKAGFHNRQLTPLDIDAARRPPTQAERLEVWSAISRALPGLRSSGHGTACVYTMSVDESFLIGRSREMDGVAYASACSGHGFKFAPAIGEALAELALDGRTSTDISAFDPQGR